MYTDLVLEVGNLGPPLLQGGVRGGKAHLGTSLGNLCVHGSVRSWGTVSAGREPKIQGLRTKWPTVSLANFLSEGGESLDNLVKLIGFRQMLQLSRKLCLFWRQLVN